MLAKVHEEDPERPSDKSQAISRAATGKIPSDFPSGHRKNPKRFPERPPNKSQAISRAATEHIPRAFFRVGIYPKRCSSDGSESRRVYPGIFAKSCGKWVGIWT